MAKFKICPTCGKENPTNSLSCIECDMDLSSVKITDTEALVLETAAEHGEADRDDGGAEMVRICECGEVNPAQARKCQACGEDISDIAPVSAPQKQEVEAHYMLSSVTGDYHYRIPCSGAVIGREHGMSDCLASKRFVSRVHARLSVENGQLFIENLSTTNYTFVNNMKIAEGRVKLNVGDEVGLGGIYANGTRQDGAAYFVVGLTA